jgi:septum formation protein
MPIVDKRVYLASRSPRRRELLKQIGVNFELLMLRSFPESRADVVEAPQPGESPADSALRLARSKAEIGWLRSEQRGLRRLPVLGADTVVALDATFLGKPTSSADATEMLNRLSGREHTVFTAVAMALEERCEVKLSSTAVRFRELTPDEVRNYVATGEPMDKAGGYAIQGRAGAFIERIEGSYSGVVGLPLFETSQLLKLFGLTVL